uniref:Uncharacterized protein n=1 Tax=Aegilops tauschii TaxID=37682 RepID=M8BYD3_AEGTA
MFASSSSPLGRRIYFIVWDPTTDNQRVISADSKLLKTHCAGKEITWVVIIVCAKYCCDHLGCRDDPFLVAFVSSNVVEKTIFASIYSSENTEWSEMISVETLNVVVTYILVPLSRWGTLRLQERKSLSRQVWLLEHETSDVQCGQARNFTR